MKGKYQYMKSSKNEPKHEISRKDFIKALGESNHCVKVNEIGNTGLWMGIADYKAAENKVKSAQRHAGSSIWCCDGVTLYLERRRK